MNILNIFKKEKIEERSYNSSNFISTMFTGNKFLINKSLVHQLPCVESNVKKIAGIISTLDINLLQKEYNYNKYIEKDKRLYCLNLESNAFSTSSKLKYQIAEDLLFYGTSYIKVFRKHNDVEELYHIPFETVTEQSSIDKNGRIVGTIYNYTLNQITCTSDEEDIVKIESGSMGILNSPKILELLIEYDQSLLTTIKNACTINGVLETSGRLTDPVANKLRASWKKLYSGSKNAGNTVILEEGLQYKSLDVGMFNKELIESKKGFIDDVDRIFGTFGITNNDDLLKFVIAPLVNAIENSFNKDLLLEDEKVNNYKFQFDCSKITRLNYAEHLETVCNGVDKGLYTINEGRKELNRKPFLVNDEESQFLNLSMGKVMLKSDGTIILPNMGSSIDMTTGEVLTSNKPIMEVIE
ncbi:phage portal protein [Clostridium botulinum]|uniref:phage portal protein n=1 Tax=Clostridium botulinum TaxID=1491 RepID=UPI0003791CFC|nr:phage portal protein [Clostridium botulinum]